MGVWESLLGAHVSDTASSLLEASSFLSLGSPRSY